MWSTAVPFACSCRVSLPSLLAKSSQSLMYAYTQSTKTCPWSLTSSHLFSQTFLVSLACLYVALPAYMAPSAYLGLSHVRPACQLAYSLPHFSRLSIYNTSYNRLVNTKHVYTMYSISLTPCSSLYCKLTPDLL